MQPLQDHFEILGHGEAVRWVEEIVREECPLTEQFIRELHKLILKEPQEKRLVNDDGIPTVRRIEVGEYKSSPIHILTATGEQFYFVIPEETPARMAELVTWYREKK